MSNVIYNPNDNITIFDAATYIGGEYRGVTDEVVLSLSEDTKDFKDARGNKYQSINLVPEITGTVKVRDMTLRNLMLGLKASEDELAAATNTVNAILVPGKTVILPHMHVSNVIVTKVSDSTILGAGAAYRVNAGHGIIDVLAGITADTPVTITYTFDDQTHLGLLNGQSPVVTVDFAVTRLHDDSPVRVGLFKAKFKVQKSLNLAGNDYASIDLEFTTLSDNSKAADYYLGKYGYVMGKL